MLCVVLVTVAHHQIVNQSVPLLVKMGEPARHQILVAVHLVGLAHFVLMILMSVWLLFHHVTIFVQIHQDPIGVVVSIMDMS